MPSVLPYISNVVRRFVHRAGHVRHVPSLNQGSLLVIRSSPRIELDVSLVPSWRDDGLLELSRCSGVGKEDDEEEDEEEEEEEEAVGMLVRIKQDGEKEAESEGIDVGFGAPKRSSAPLSSGKSTVCVYVDVERHVANFASRCVEAENRFSSSCSYLSTPSFFFNAANRIAGVSDEDRHEECLESMYRDISTWATATTATATATAPRIRPVSKRRLLLTALVPEKINLSCRLYGPGDIDATSGKMEGMDGFDMATYGGGSIRVKKLRGDIVSLDARLGRRQAGESNGDKAAGCVYAYTSLEGKTVRVRAEHDMGRNDCGGAQTGMGEKTRQQRRQGERGGGGRVRAKLINGSDVLVHVARGPCVGGDDNDKDDDDDDDDDGRSVGVTNKVVKTKPKAEQNKKDTDKHKSKSHPSFESCSLPRFDLDDALALVDVSSLYTSRGGNGAQIIVDVPVERRLVRGAGATDDNEQAAAAAARDDNDKPFPTKRTTLTSVSSFGATRAIRIKSSHGHVSASASTNVLLVDGDDGAGAKVTKSLYETEPTYTSMDNEYGNYIPVVELGGVNGSCDVRIDRHSVIFAPKEGKKEYDGKHENNDNNDEDRNDVETRVGANGGEGAGRRRRRRRRVEDVAARVHIDALSPDSISTIVVSDNDNDSIDDDDDNSVKDMKNPSLSSSSTAAALASASAGGLIELTVDRKVTADVRLASCPNVNDWYVEDEFLADDEEEMKEDVKEYDENDELKQDGENTMTMTTTTTTKKSGHDVAMAALIHHAQKCSSFHRESVNNNADFNNGMSQGGGGDNDGDDDSSGKDTIGRAGTRNIQIQTDSFEQEANLMLLLPRKNGKVVGEGERRGVAVAEYVGGRLENKSHEMDSRFDALTSRVQTRTAGGKINVGGAAEQALHGFSSMGKVAATTTNTTPQTLLRPLLFAASSGPIRLETVSWLGAIARRYGMDESETQKQRNENLGRQAKKSVPTSSTSL